MKYFFYLRLEGNINKKDYFYPITKIVSRKKKKKISKKVHKAIKERENFRVIKIKILAGENCMNCQVFMTFFSLLIFARLHPRIMTHI